MSLEDGGRSEELDASLSDQDLALLAAVRSMWDSADHVPPHLVDRVRFGLDLDPVDFEVSRLVPMREAAGARSDEYARLVTFQSDSLTVMITVEQCADGTARIDGWLTPAACRHIELRCSTGAMSTESDDTGRFSIEAVAVGTVRFIVHDTSGSRRVITPAIEI